MLMSVLQKTVGSIVDENYVYARALHYLGIDFFKYEEKTLDEICREKSIEKRRLIKNFYQCEFKSRIPFHELEAYPLRLVLELLRHAHHSYIKDHLPYIARLISALKDSDNPLVEDLKAVFPLFVEDFIHHIYEEEDHLFNYLDVLVDIERQRVASPLSSLWKFRNLSLKELKSHHEEEDEMESMRSLVDELPRDDLHIKVIIQEIQAFDRELLYHAEIENSILFPKAINIEEKVWQLIHHLSLSN
jgi:regulator of cell morphogenesis and NO signaling